MTSAKPEMATQREPYKGPRQLEFGDPIFGRDDEIDSLIELLLGDRIVLLHSLSGCGKSSLLEAGVRRRMPAGDFLSLPTIRLKAAGGRQTGRNPLVESVKNSLRGADGIEWEPTADETLRGFLRSRRRDPSDSRFEFLIFDQFEEAVTAEAGEAEREEFFRQLGLLLAGRSVWAAIAIREDYLGPLEPYLRLLPTQLSSRFRLKQFTEKQAKDAIEGPAAQYGVVFEGDALDSLVKSLSRVDENPSAQALVEPVHMQVVCRYIWSHKKDPGRITLDDLRIEGRGMASVDEALGGYYAASVSLAASDDEDRELQIRDWVGGSLIDKSGQRTRVRLRDELSAAELKTLVDAYLIRPNTDMGLVLELAHDRLVSPIMANNREWRSGRVPAWFVAAEQWDLKGRPGTAYLVRGDELDEALRWSATNQKKMGERERAFLQQCQLEEKRRRQANSLKVKAIIAGLCAVAASLSAIYKIAEARRTIRAADARSVAAQAETMKAGEFASVTAATAKELVARTDAQVRRIGEEAERKLKDADEQLNSAVRTAQRSKDEAVAAQMAMEKTRSELDETKAEAEKELARAKGEYNKLGDQLTQVAKESSYLAETAVRLEHERTAMEKVDEAKRSRNLVPVVDAIKAMVEGNHLVKPSVAQSVLATARELFSRGLLIRTLPFTENWYVLGLSFNAKENCLVAISESGEIQTRSAEGSGPCSQATAGRVGGRGPLVESVAYPTASAFGPGGTLALVGDSSGALRFVDLASPSSRTRRLFKQPVSALTISPSGNYFAASNALWRLGAWRRKENLPLEQADRVLFRPNSPPIGWFRWLDIFLGKGNQLVNSMAIHEFPGDSSRGGVLAVARQDGSVEVYRLNSMKYRHTTRYLKLPGLQSFNGRAQPLGAYGHRQSALIVSFSPDGKVLASGGRDGDAILWDLSRGPKSWSDDEQRILKTPILLGGCRGSVLSLAFAPAGEGTIAVGCQDGKIRLYDTAIGKAIRAGGETRTPIETLDSALGEVRTLTFDPEHRRLFAGGARPGLEVWRIPTREMFARRRLAMAELQQLEELASSSQGPTKDMSPNARALTHLEQFAVEFPERESWRK